MSASEAGVTAGVPRTSLTAEEAAAWYEGRPMVVRSVGRDGSLTAVVPVDPAVDERRTAALRVMEAEQAAAWEQVQAALPHRHERRPERMAAQDREQQERSLGRPYGAGERQGDIGGKSGVCWLHPMGDEVYLRTLAGQLPELAPRLARMREEMAARPEEFGKGDGARVFDLALFRDCGEPWPTGDEVRMGLAGAEATLAAFVCWVASPRTLQGIAAAALVLSGMSWWGQRSRWVFGTWARWPWFCGVG